MAARLGATKKASDDDDDGWGSEEETKKKKKKEKKKRQRSSSKVSHDIAPSSRDQSHDIFGVSDEEEKGGGLFSGTGVKFDEDDEPSETPPTDNTSSESHTHTLTFYTPSHLHTLTQLVHLVRKNVRWVLCQCLVVEEVDCLMTVMRTLLPHNPHRL